MSTTTPSRKVNRRELILQATVQVVADSGLRGLTFRAVGDQAGVNNSLIAHYFGNRDQLIEAAIEWSVKQSIESTHLLEFATAPDEFVLTLLNSLDEHPELQIFQYEMILEARRTPELRPAVRRLYATYEQAIDESMKNMGVIDLSEADRRGIFGAFDGLVLQRVSGLISSEEFVAAHRRVIALAQQVSKTQLVTSPTSPA